MLGDSHSSNNSLATVQKTYTTATSSETLAASDVLVPLAPSPRRALAAAPMKTPSYPTWRTSDGTVHPREPPHFGQTRSQLFLAL